MKKPTKMCPEVAQSIRSTMFESGEDNQFSRVMQPIFTIMVVLGLQPFASSKRSSESKASILKRLYNRYFTFGFFFWLPLPFIGCRATFLSMKAYANTVQKYGFFDSTTVSIMQTWLLVQIGWIFAIYAFVFASRIVTMIGKFDEILLSPLALSHFRKVTYGMTAVLLFTIFAYTSVKTASTIMSINDLSDGYQLSPLFIFDIFTLFYFSLLCFIGPTAWITVTSFFIAHAFRQHRGHLKEAMKDQTDSLNIKRIYFEYVRLTNVIDYADSVLSPITFISVSTYVILLCTSILNATALSDHYAFSLAYSFIHLDALLGICLSAISLNDEARAIQCDLHDYVPESFEVYVLMGKFDRKASDSGWGFTMGRMFLLEKRKFVALFGAMLTFIALWSQFAQHENGCQSSNSTTSVNLIVELGLYF